MASPSHAYHGPGGEPRLRRSVAGFCDLLGFSQACTSDPTESQHLLRRITDAIADSREFVRREFEHERRAEAIHWSLKFFSDNLVFAYPSDLDEESRAWAAWFVVRCVQRYQFRMALNGFFVRGALTEGLICLTDEIVFGPALVEAYRLESKTSIVPRVVITELLYGLLRQPSAGQARPSDAADLICRDIDGWSFINYLDAAQVDGRIDWLLIEQHKSAVLSSLASTTRHDVLPKFGWSCRYHNVFCHWHTGDPGYSPRYRIDRTDEASTLHRMRDRPDGVA